MFENESSSQTIPQKELSPVRETTETKFTSGKKSSAINKENPSRLESSQVLQENNKINIVEFSENEHSLNTNLKHRIESMFEEIKKELMMFESDIKTIE